jgi:hypothetical protein
MPSKKSLAKKRYWSKFTKAQKSGIFSERVRKGWAKKTEEERKAQGKKLTEAKLKKLSTQTIVQ